MQVTWSACVYHQGDEYETGSHLLVENSNKVFCLVRICCMFTYASQVFFVVSPYTEVPSTSKLNPVVDAVDRRSLDLNQEIIVPVASSTIQQCKVVFFEAEAWLIKGA